MARRPRTVFCDLPHHVTQRGNYRQDVFLGDEDRRRYLEWLHTYARKYGLDIWAYCLMDNHVHLIAVPRNETALARTLATVHMRHAQSVNRQHQLRGHLWQGRFFSCPMDETYLLAAARYVECNPVRAGLVTAPAQWPWSSAPAHLGGPADPLLDGAGWPEPPLLRRWAQLLATAGTPEEIDAIRRQTYSGRPLGTQSFVHQLEDQAGHPLAPRPRGRPRKTRTEG